MNTKRILLACAAALLPAAAQSLDVKPILGIGNHGDGGPAREALLYGPAGLAEDADGNLYVAEAGAGVIRRILAGGTIERFAGTGTLRDGPEDLPALETDLMRPTALLAAPGGGLLFADLGACRIRKVEPSGEIHNVAGTGHCTASTGLGGFGGGTANRNRLALETEVASVGVMIFDPAGRLVFSDPAGNRIRRIDDDGFLRTIAGTGAGGFSGDGGAASAATFLNPAGLAYDGDGNLYVADGGNCRIRKIDTDGAISSIAGTTRCSTSGAGFPLRAASTAALGIVSGLVWDEANRALIFGVPGQARVTRLLVDEGVMEPIAGNGRVGAVDSAAPLELSANTVTSVLLSNVWGVVFAAERSYLVQRVKDGVAETVAGRWPQLTEYPSAEETPLLAPRGLCRMPHGDLVVADAGAERILTLREPNAVTTAAGRRYPSGYTSTDATAALEASLGGVTHIACGPDGTLFFLDGSRVRKIDAAGILRSVWSGLSDPGGIAIDEAGRVIVSEMSTQQIRRIDPVLDRSDIIAGKGTVGFSGDGAAATTAQMDTPTEIALDRRGNIYFVDSRNRRVRQIGVDGNIRTVAGSRRDFGYDDITGRKATDVGFGTITGLSADADGTLYIAEENRITRVDTEGKIQVLWGFTGEDDDGVPSYRIGPVATADAILATPEGPVISLRQQGRVVRLEVAK